ncbi:hypothetical protein MF069_36530 [Paenibacillus mucilaginosus]|uniref:hypothetical protein n=1 Tax=Paenibacillus mucilaginosus TaxID=61624 RepID=UPI001EF0500B|nr:hypothetical protein [Paenibacillus mucilaginosus]MCG7218208.1 hypothetical protein [Paenibacillus mucilaginosus]
MAANLFEKSPYMPSIPKMYDISDLFANFGFNWLHLAPVMALLLGVLFAFFVLQRIIWYIQGRDPKDAKFDLKQVEWIRLRKRR